MSSFRLSLLGCAIAAATAGIAPDVLAVDLCAGQSGTVAGEAAPADGCTLDTAGATLAVTAGGRIGQGVLVSATATSIDNAGVINGVTTAVHYQVFDNGSTFDNHGIVSVDGGNDAFALRIDATLDAGLRNDGVLAAVASAATGTVRAAGLQGGALVGIALDNDGDISAEANAITGAASALALGTGALIDGATLANSGTVAAHAEGDTARARAWGASVGNILNAGVSNAGTISASASVTGSSHSAQAHGLFSAGYGLSDNAGIANSGSISATASSGQMAYAWGLEMTNSLGGAGLISNRGDIAATATGGWSRSEAYGIWTYWMFNDSRVDNTGTVSAAASAMTSAAAWGIRTEGQTNSAVVSNRGSISASAHTSVAGQARAIGIFSLGGLSGVSRLQNDGDLSVIASNTGAGPAYAAGIYTSSVGAGTIVGNDGTLFAEAIASSGVANAYGVAVADLDGVVINTGIIDVAASAGGVAYTVFAQAGAGLVQNSGILRGAVNLQEQVSLSNSGTILVLDETAHVGGDFTQSGRGQLLFPLLPGTPHGVLQVDGTADFSAGPRLRVVLDLAQPLADGDRFDGLVTAGALLAPQGGRFRILDNSLFWRFEQDLTATTLGLVARRVGAASALAPAGVAFTPGQLALADHIVASGITGPWAELATAFETAPDASAGAGLLLQAGPALAGAAGQATRLAGRGAEAVVAARLEAMRGTGAGDDSAHGAIWLRPFSGRATQDAVQGIPGYELEGEGFVLGLDGEFGDALRVGIAAAATSSEVAGVTSRLDIEGARFTLYASQLLTPATTLDIDAGYGTNRYRSSRALAFTGGVARAGHAGHQLGAGLALTHRISLARSFALLPGLDVRYGKVHVDRYQETGAGNYNLAVHDQVDSAVRAVARVASELALPFGTLATSLGVGRDSAEAAGVSATLAGGPAFAVQGIAPDETLYTGTVGFRHVASAGLEFEVAYELERRDSLAVDTASLRFLKRF